MTLTLTNAINDTQTTIAVTGTVGAEIVPNSYLCRVDDEVMLLVGFGRTIPTRGWPVDPNVWIVQRGDLGSVADSHMEMTEIEGVNDAYVSGSDEDEPGPFILGAVTPAAYVEPTEATPEAIANALINAGLMEGPP